MLDLDYWREICDQLEAEKVKLEDDLDKLMPGVKVTSPKQLKEWLEKGGALPPIEGLREELHKVQYKFSKHGRLMLTPKEEIKDKLGRSPDTADALALTFARPVSLTSNRRRGLKNLMCNTDYCIMDAV